MELAKTNPPVFVPPNIGGYVENVNGYKYKIIKSLSDKGAFGSVFLGVDIFENAYALKVFRPANRAYEDVRSMWLREAKTLRELFHPNIAYLHDSFEYKCAFYLVFELLGAPLNQFARGQAQVDDKTLLLITRQLLFGLSFIHWHNIVHNDLSLDNVLTSTDNNWIKITDFGISRAFAPVGQPEEQDSLPIIFNRSIVCPDLVRDGGTTAQSDLYHVGLILLSLKLGHPPIDPTLPADQIQKLSVEGVPRTLAENLKTPLGDKIAILLRRTAQARYSNAMTAWQDFRELHIPRYFD